LASVTTPRICPVIATCPKAKEELTAKTNRIRKIFLAMTTP
jgi:hypothetical protein